jgi:hypothetical protein
MNRKKILHSMGAASILGVGVLILTYSLSNGGGVDRDFISYWAAGKQLIHHGNPYDGPAILALENGAGSSDVRPFFMRNPPTAFFLTLLIAFFSTRTGALLWSLAIVAALMASIRMIWKIKGQPKDPLHLLGYLFPPALACLLAGQIGIFILLGVTLFLFFHERRPYIAGAALLLCSFKPHLLIPFGTILIVWAATQRKHRVLIGATAALTASLLFSYLLDPHGWTQYAAMISSERLGDELIPTVSLIFRLSIHHNWLWLQLVPAAAGTIWALHYFVRHRRSWNWIEQGMLVLLVSVMVAPYAWFTDEAVLLPAILISLYTASEAGRSLIPFGCIAGIALIEVLAGVEVNSAFYIWTTPAWLAWYLWSAHKKGVAEREIVAV